MVECKINVQTQDLIRQITLADHFETCTKKKRLRTSASQTLCRSTKIVIQLYQAQAFSKPSQKVCIDLCTQQYLAIASNFEGFHSCHLGFENRRGTKRTFDSRKRDTLEAKSSSLCSSSVLFFLDLKNLFQSWQQLIRSWDQFWSPSRVWKKKTAQNLVSRSTIRSALAFLQRFCKLRGSEFLQSDGITSAPNFNGVLVLFFCGNKAAIHWKGPTPSLREAYARCVFVVGVPSRQAFSCACAFASAFANYSIYIERSFREVPSPKKNMEDFYCLRWWLRRASRPCKTQRKCLRGLFWSSTFIEIPASKKNVTQWEMAEK